MHGLYGYYMDYMVIIWIIWIIWIYTYNTCGGAYPALHRLGDPSASEDGCSKTALFAGGCVSASPDVGRIRTSVRRSQGGPSARAALEQCVAVTVPALVWTNNCR